MLGFLALTSKRDPASGGINKAADEHALGGPFAGHVLSYFVVELVGSEHIATMAIHAAENTEHSKHETLKIEQSCIPFNDTIGVIYSRDGHFTILGLVKHLVLQVELGSYPADIDVSRILAREDPHTVKVLVDQTEAFAVQRVKVFGVSATNASRLSHRAASSFGWPSIRDGWWR